MIKIHQIFILIILLKLISCQVNKTKNKSQTIVSNNIENGDLKYQPEHIDSVNVYIGIVKLKEDYQKGNLEIFNSDSSLWKSFEFSDSFSNILIKPYQLKPEYNLLVFSCVGEIGSYYSVVVNELQHEIKYIKKSDSFFIFETWENLIMDVFSIDFNYKKNPLRILPSETSNKIKRYDNESFYYPVKIKDDWLLIKDDSNKEGWIKWKNNKGELIITLYFDS